MTTDDPMEWTDPSSWPWPFYVWIVFVVVGCAKPVWQWISRRRAASWRVVPGRIETAFVRREDTSFFRPRYRDSPVVAELTYSYATGEYSGGGWYRRDFATEQEANEFICDLEGKPVMIHCNPDNPSRSTLSEVDLERLLQFRPPGSGEEWQIPGEPVPEWTKPFVWITAGMAALAARGSNGVLYAIN